MRFPEGITDDLQLGSETILLATGEAGIIVLINTYEETDTPYLVEGTHTKQWRSASEFVAEFRGWEY